MPTLNTNTRYLHRSVVAYAERLSALLPPPLEVCFLVNSGSEANDLALRIARVATGRDGTIVLDAAYHGNLSSLIEISPYKFQGPGGFPRSERVRVLPLPDCYRGELAGDKRPATAYGEQAVDLIGSWRGDGFSPGMFVAESLPGCGGQIELPTGYLQTVYGEIRRQGGLCVADEVQVGFGRVGDHFWGFERQGVVPDIVTMGKPIGNGHPLGAVVTSRPIAEAFANGMEYFNTFGGNPVSAEIGMAVLDVIEREGLQRRAADLGRLLRTRLEELQRRFEVIGDVRGSGLFLGIELVDDREARIPSAAIADYVANRLRDQQILISTDGPDHNVLKIKPPLVIDDRAIERFLDVLEDVLRENRAQPLAGSSF